MGDYKMCINITKKTGKMIRSFLRGQVLYDIFSFTNISTFCPYKNNVFDPAVTRFFCIADWQGATAA